MGKSEFRIAISGIMIAMAFVLSYIKLPGLPYGGSVTLFSMIPVIFLSCMYGAAWGFCTGLVYSLLQLLQSAGGSAFAGMNAKSVVLIILFDFVLAFSVLGLGGMFITKKNIAKKTAPLLATAGAFIVTLARYFFHVISGFVLYGKYAEWFFEEEWVNGMSASILKTFSGKSLSFIYSAVYNGLYMIPEIVLTTVGVFVLFTVLMNIKTTKSRIVAERSAPVFLKKKPEEAK